MKRIAEKRKIYRGTRKPDFGKFSRPSSFQNGTSEEIPEANYNTKSDSDMLAMPKGMDRSKLSSKEVREAWSKIKGESNEQYFKRKVQTNVRKTTAGKG